MISVVYNIAIFKAIAVYSVATINNVVSYSWLMLNTTVFHGIDLSFIYSYIKDFITL